MMLSDLHVHSNFSDGQLSIPELIDFYGTRGFGVIAITDHICEEFTLLGRAAAYLNKTLTRATFPTYKKILTHEAARAWDQYGMLVLPGFELTKNSISNHRSAHILGIGQLETFEYVSADGDVSDIIKSIKAQGALAVAAHPVWTGKLEKQTYHLWDRKEELAELFDAWEIASGPHFFEEVGRSNLPKLATSDFHRPTQVNAWKTIINAEKTPESILHAIRQQDISFHFYSDKILAGGAREFNSSPREPAARCLATI